MSRLHARTPTAAQAQTHSGRSRTPTIQTIGTSSACAGRGSAAGIWSGATSITNPSPCVSPYTPVATPSWLHPLQSLRLPNSNKARRSSAAPLVSFTRVRHSARKQPHRLQRLLVIDAHAPSTRARQDAYAPFSAAAAAAAHVLIPSAAHRPYSLIRASLAQVPLCTPRARGSPGDVKDVEGRGTALRAEER
ncbi:hypothetical protein C8J57DRAFT_1726900 [Mycena rebaudengoi]|nr:hypothetical protein C8J57DRAFT_1726900 [Mycena rebaudengoi]